MKTFCFLVVCLSFAASVLGQETRAVPHVVVVFDDSGSMDTPLSSNRSVTKLEAAKTALKTVLSKVEDGSKVGVYLLNGQYDPATRQNEKWWVPYGPLNQKEAIKRIGELKTNGNTPLGSAIKGGCDALIAARKADHYGTYRLLIVSDGEANSGSEANKVEQYIPDIMARGFITVDVIGVDMSAGHTLATKVHTYRNAADSASLEKAIQAVFQAESDPNDANTAEDYVLTSAIPSEMAAEAIKTLSKTGTHAVGEQPELKLDSPQTNFQAPPPAQSSGGWGWVIGVGIVVAIGFVVIVIINSANNY